MTIEDNDIIKTPTLLQAYDDKIAQAVHDLVASLPDLKHQSDNLVGSGRHRHVFPLVTDGKDCVLKLMHDDHRKVDVVEAVEDAEKVSSKTRDLDHFEKIRAASAVDRVIIAEKVKGETLKACGFEIIGAITDEQIKDFLNEAVKALARGVVFDPNPSNLMYDPENGFTAIDLSMKDNAEWPGAGLAGLFNIGADHLSLNEGHEFETEECKVALALLEKVQRIAFEIPEIDRDFLRQCRTDIYTNKEVINSKARKKSGFLKRLVKR